MTLYGPNVLPTGMASNAGPGGVAFASVGLGDDTAWKLCDGDIATYMYLQFSAPWVVGIRMPTAKRIRKIRYRSYVSDGHYSPQDFGIEVSADGMAYTVVKSVVGQVNPDNTWIEHEFANAIDGEYLQLNVTSTLTTQLAMMELQAFEALPPPTVTDVSPGGGALAGGTAVTITGTGFDGVSDISFGGVPATDVVTVGPTSLTCTAPAGSGLVDVVVTNGDASEATLANGYFYSDPAAPSDAPVTAPGLGLALGLGL